MNYHAPLVILSTTAGIVSVIYRHCLLEEICSRHREKTEVLSGLQKATMLEKYRARQELAAQLLLFSPDWVKENTVLNRLCNRYRLYFWLMWIPLIGILLIEGYSS